MDAFRLRKGFRLNRSACKISQSLFLKNKGRIRETLKRTRKIAGQHRIGNTDERKCSRCDTKIPTKWDFMFEKTTDHL